jgi:predicted nucleotidyltransferase component of viral defense system
MAKTNILIAKQKQLLNLVSKSNLANHLYWTGGTALAEIYFKHRLSTDLDFFTDDIIDKASFNIFIQTLKKHCKKISVKELSNRTLMDIDGIKMEIVYFPFPHLAKFHKYDSLNVDSLTDLATNKLLAFYQRNEPKDIFDLYFILQDKFTLKQLIKNVEEKFGEQLSTDLIIAKIHNDLSALNMLKPLLIDKKILPKIKKYFDKISKTILNDILV